MERRLVSPSSYLDVEQTRDVKVRTSLTSRGIHGFSAWNYSGYSYTLGQINLGSNPLSKLEVASCLNLFNYASYSWWYSEDRAAAKYNPKVYFGTIQGVSKYWNLESNSGLKSGQKSGS